MAIVVQQEKGLIRVLGPKREEVCFSMRLEDHASERDLFEAKANFVDAICDRATALGEEVHWITDWESFQ